MNDPLQRSSRGNEAHSFESVEWRHGLNLNQSLLTSAATEL
jgi:hypothetical protein